MPIASKLLYFQRRPSPAPPDPGPEPPDPRRRAGRDASARQRRRSSLSSHHKPGQEPVPGNQRDTTKCLGPAGNITEHVAGISRSTRLNRSVSDHGRLPDAVQQARERLLQRLNSVDLSGRRQKTCPLETSWAGLARSADFTPDCILGTLTNCFQPGEPITARKVEESTADVEPIGTDAEERTPITLFPEGEPVPELEGSACNGGAAEEGDDRSCEAAPAECSICLERCCAAAGDGLTQLHCRHVFHSACLERWLRSRGDCPYCRATVLCS
ncbi:unnamed protein product [Urochloa decumbens]|uniref:RING-type domain-containing protein n=1 Tax=Urochloa decumbens TaxID=240449 RepID=A0ABC9GF95_9POAL